MVWEELPTLRKLQLDLDRVSTTGCNNNRCRRAAKNAFTNSGWLHRGPFPTNIWYEFKEFKQVQRIGFSNSYTKSLSLSPKKFSIIGSKRQGCGRWKNLRKALNANFDRKKQHKYWDIPRTDVEGYKCYGLKFNSNGAKGIFVKNMAMWIVTQI